MYNNDPALPILQSGKRERYTVSEAARILMQNDETKKCTKTPLKVRRNMSFLIDVKSFKHWEDVKSDMNGSYSRPLVRGRLKSTLTETSKCYIRKRCLCNKVASSTSTLIQK